MLGIELKLEFEIVKVDLENKILMIDKGDVYSYGILVIVIGFMVGVLLFFIVKSFMLK